MTPETRKLAVTKSLQQLEQALKQRNLWEGVPPSPEAMSSTTPFCVDTMTFTQWLQWIFLPRMQALLDAGAPLPQGCDMTPYAEESFKLQVMDDSAGLLKAVKGVDESLQ
ncbi:YqcC family protein [Endozoicomonadaceae bacterium StTr2]